MNDREIVDVPYNGKNKFNWEKGDVTFILPQCAYCERNLGADECEIYGPKPRIFLMNKEECPYKVIPKVEETLDVIDDEQERENMDNIIGTLYNKSSKDYSKCLFRGNKYAKSRLVLAVLKEYVNSTKVTFKELKRTFNDSIQGSSGVLQTVEYVHNKDPKRFFIKPDEILITSDNVKFAVSNQWGKDNIDRFIKVATEKGFEITRVEL